MVRLWPHWVADGSVVAALAVDGSVVATLAVDGSVVATLAADGSVVAALVVSILCQMVSLGFSNWCSNPSHCGIGSDHIGCCGYWCHCL